MIHLVIADLPGGHRGPKAIWCSACAALLGVGGSANLGSANLANPFAECALCGWSPMGRSSVLHLRTPAGGLGETWVFDGIAEAIDASHWEGENYVVDVRITGRIECADVQICDPVTQPNTSGNRPGKLST